ncbi:MAG: 1-(5-phosphoribosyl)-5-[(5-phosphoribosylamino)methylideneamino]imidazole-4-carboxamide isomerase [Candidatus Porifericomitaceae bacterium WSBS_2022_MAG_OTU9]
MELIPAIDLRNGRCVRLRQGRLDQETLYSENPVEVASHWVDSGARRLHLIDLDGAHSGKPENTDVIHEIVQSFPDITIQVGGGIRDEDTIQKYFDAGVTYIVLGTRAVSSPHFVSDACIEFPNHIIVSLDAKNGRLATDGWSKLSRHHIDDLLPSFREDGVAAIIFTDISRDGMLTNVDTKRIESICNLAAVPIIAAGGITDLSDIEALCNISDSGLAGAIIGKALYENTLDFATALKIADANKENSGAAS